MAVHALVTAIGTGPKPAIFTIFDGGNKVLADLVGGGSRIAMFVEDDVAEFLFVPVLHIVFLLFFPLLFPSVLIQVPLGHLLADIEVMAEFTFPSFVAMTLLEKLAENCLWIYTKGDLLYLDWLKQLGSLSLGLFGGGFLFGSLLLLGFFSFFLGRLVGFCLSRQLGYLSLRRATLFILHTKSLVFDRGLFLGRLIALDFRRHGDNDRERYGGLL